MSGVRGGRTGPIGSGRRCGCAVALAAVAALLPVPLAAQAPPDVSVELTPTEHLTVGDRVEATVRLVWLGDRPKAPPRFPAWQERWGGAAVLAAGSVDGFQDQAGRWVYEQHVTLTAFRPGDVKLPPLTLALPLADRTVEVTTPDDLSFTVDSVLPPPDETPEEGIEPRPPAPLRELTEGPLFAWTAGLLAALVAIAAVAVVRRRAPVEATAAPEPLLDPLPELIRRLEALDATAGEPAHTALSAALRRYLGRILGFQALESTTTEIRRRLRAGPVPAAIGQELVGLLGACDQVKFARQEVAAGVTRERLRAARELAKRLDESLRPAEPEERAA